MLQAEGDRLDKTTNGKWVLDSLESRTHIAPEPGTIIVDCVRTTKQIDHIRKSSRSLVTHVHLTAPLEVLRKRYNQRYAHSKAPSYDQMRRNRTEARVGKLAKVADVVIDTKRCLPNDVLVRAASYTSFYGDTDDGYVDVVVGGQFGSEGKGQIVSFISQEYDLLVRVGGPNAGHKVFEVPEPYTHHHLPSGTRKSNAKLLLAPGAVIQVDKLLREIAECKVDKDRLTIDPGAVIITPEDVAREERLKRLLNGRQYKSRAHDVLTVDMRALVERHQEDVWLSSMNSGAFFGSGRRGIGTFKRIDNYPFEELRKRKRQDAVVEVAVDYAVKDIAEITTMVERWVGSKPVQVIWKRAD